MFISDVKANSMVREAVNLERDHARVRVQALKQAHLTAQNELDELREQVKALLSQAETSVEKQNNLEEKNNNQASALVQLRREQTELQSKVDQQAAVINVDDQAKIMQAQAQRISHLQDQVQEFDHVWDVLNEATSQVAEDNGYCEEYDSLVEEVNDALTRRTKGHRLMQARTMQYNVTLVLEVTIDEAKDQEDALEQARDNLDNGAYSSYDVDTNASFGQSDA